MIKRITIALLTALLMIGFTVPANAATYTRVENHSTSQHSLLLRESSLIGGDVYRLPINYGTNTRTIQYYSGGRCERKYYLSNGRWVYTVSGTGRYVALPGSGGSKIVMKSVRTC